MSNLENEIFGFGSENIDDTEQTSNDFNYDSISGLGESNYENDDLFRIEDSSSEANNSVGTNELVEENSNYANNFNIEVDDNNDDSDNSGYHNNFPFEDNVINNQYQNDYSGNDIVFDEQPENYKVDDNEYQQSIYSENVPEETFTDEVVPANNNEYVNNPSVEPDNTYTEMNVEEKNEDMKQDEPVIEMSETPIEELKNLTNYEEDKLEKTDIKALFDKVSVNVKDASDIFRKNSEMKEKIDSRFNELKKLQSELENSKKIQIDEINSYKDEVFEKLTAKKDEIEKRLNLLKDLQVSLEKEKSDFEQYKKVEEDKIEKIQKDVQSAYDDRREELSHIEDTLRKQKDALDEERNQLSLDRIQYESDKNDLANSILKFNELVDSFTNGMNGINE